MKHAIKHIHFIGIGGTGMKFRLLAQSLLVVALGLGWVTARAEVDYTGTWFRCDLDMTNEAWHFLHIKNQEKKLVWLLDSKFQIIVKGTAKPIKNKLVLFGCQYSEGKVLEDCSPQKPPEFMRLPLKFFSRSFPFTKKALEAGDYIKVAPFMSNKLIKSCEESRDKEIGVSSK